MNTKEVTIVLNPKINPAARMGNDVADKLRDRAADKVGASPEQLSALRLLAQKHATSGGALSELLPEAKLTSFKDRILGFLKGGLPKLGGGLNLLSAVMGGNIGGVAGAAGGLVGGPIGAGIGTGTQMVLGFLQELPRRVNALVASLDSWVRIASPGTSERFSRTMQDMYGVVGQMLTPALETVNKVFRAIADSVAGSSLGGELKGLWAEMDRVFVDMKPALSASVSMLAEFTAGMVGFTRVLAMITKDPLFKLFMATAAADMRTLAFFGSGNPNALVPGREGGSVGAAARTPSYSGFFEYGRQARLAAYGSVGVSPAQQTAKNTEDIAATAGRILDELLHPGKEVERAIQEAAEKAKRGVH